MSVQTVVEIPERATAESTATERKYQRVFRVVMTSTADGPALARDNGAIPVIGQSYATDTETDAFAFVENKRADRVAENAFDVTVSYSTLAANENNTNPLTADVQYTWAATEYQEIVDKDINDEKIVTAAEEPILGVQRRTFNAVVSISRNESYWNGALALSYLGSINSTPFLGGAAKTVMLTNISPQFLTHTDGTQYVRVTYEFTYDKRTWTAKLANQGFRYYNGTGTYLICERNEQGENIPVTTPRLLASDGTILPDGDPMTFIDAELYTAVDFNSFGF